MFAAETYVRRRRRLTEQVGAGLIVFPGNGSSPMNYKDNPYEFRQDSSFLYFFGMDAPGLAGLIDVEGAREMIFGDDVTIDDVIWMGPQRSVAEGAAEVGVAETMPLSRLAEVLGTGLRRGRQIHYLPQYRPENVLWLQDLLSISAPQVRAGASPELIRAVVAQRSVKSAAEVEEIESALDICHAMQMEAMKAIRPGAYEREIVGLIEGLVIGRGSQVAFPTIFTVHGETLHNHDHGNVMQGGDIVINDSGAESQLHYAGDITRTIPVSGQFSDRQKDVYKIVVDAQRAAFDAVRPGVLFRDVHLLACEVLAGGLKDLGVMKGDIKEAVAAGAHALFFQCGLGHMLGLDVHDMESLGEDYVGYTEAVVRSGQFGLRSLRLGRELKPGFVITVEPGLYFIPQLIDQWKAEKRLAEFINYEVVDRFRDFGGVRIEDDVLVTQKDCRILGRPIPRTVEAVEAAYGEK
ncbi:MAG: aminopeptidase P family protein [Phycisphaerae bacterium]|nr:aminopeptidase P family protein [Phycisphaerae bacterium]